MYTPIIRNRRSEISAFKSLSDEVKSNCIPLVDLAAPTKKGDTTAARAYVERNLKATTKVLGGFKAVLLDSSELDPTLRVANQHPLIAAAQAITARHPSPIPVTGLHRDDAHMKAALKVRKQSEHDLVCFRLDATDVGTASLSRTQLLNTLADNSIPTTDVILLLDLQSVYGMDAEALSVQIERFLARVSDQKWRATIVGGYGVPDQLTAAIAVRGQGYIARTEQEVFRLVSNASSLDDLWFGDYTTLSPTHVELDWRVVSKVMSPKAIYALEESWFVVRGGPFSSHKDGYDQYHQLAREIVALEEFCGPQYSPGDAYIHDCATNDESTSGSPASWITACVNHHITFTANNHA